jgi:hypothetical protein
MSFKKGTVCGQPGVDTLVHFIVMGPRERQQTIIKVSALLLASTTRSCAAASTQ